MDPREADEGPSTNLGMLLILLLLCSRALLLTGEQARPLPEDVVDHGARYSLAQRAQCVTLMSLGLPATETSKLCGIPARSCLYIWKKARDQGYDPQRDPKVLDHYLLDKPRSGRPKKDSCN